MTGAHVVYALIVGTLIAAGAWAIERVIDDQLRPRISRMPVPGGRWIWAAALMLTIGLILTPSTREPVGGSAVSIEASPVVEETSAPRGVGDVPSGEPDVVGFADDITARAGAMLDDAFGPTLGRLWMLSAAAGFLFLLLTYARYRWIREHLPAAELRGREVLVSSSIGPAVIGVLTPAIVVPRWLLGRSAEEQDVVLSHEAEHIRARDHQLLLAGIACLTVIAWHPAAWWMIARLRLAMELDCDRRVLRRGLSPQRYGNVLIDLAAHCSRTSIASTALADGASHLERRIHAMTTTRARGRLSPSLALATASGFLISTACAISVPTNVAPMQGEKAPASVASTAPEPVDSAAKQQVADIRTPTTAPTTSTTASASSTRGGRGGGQASTSGTGIIGTYFALSAQPLWIIDGVPIRDFNRSMVDSLDIVSVEVIKGHAAIKEYGTIATHGAIHIKTKK